MTASEREVLCGDCRVVLTGPLEPGPSDTLSCPKCGKSASLSVVMKTVEGFVHDHVAGQLDATIKKAVSGSSMLSYNSKPRLKHHYDFIVDL